MRLVLGVATADATLRAFVSSKRDLIVPPEALAKGYLKEARVRISAQILALDHQSTSADLGYWLGRLAGSADALLLLIDKDHRHLVADYEDAYFIAALPEPRGKIIQNYIRAAVAPVLRHFATFSQLFDSLNNQRILLLPLDIFLAEEVALLRTLMTTGKMEPGFGQQLEQLMAAIRTRSRPKTRTRFKKAYLVDDRPLWFRYGPEEHAIVETTAPPHADNCRHNSLFRFGRAYNPRLHHNVDDDSKPTKVHASFLCCHGQTFTATGQSHLTIFPNGYI